MLAPFYRKAMGKLLVMVFDQKDRDLELQQQNLETC